MDCKALRKICATLLVVFAGIVQASDFVAPEPEDLIIYQIFIDRFDNGNTANDRGNPRGTFNPTGPFSFQGGDIAGIRRRLPYVRSLGANGIWITPFVENVNSYHGYGAFDWYKVDPNFGTLAELQAMIEEANALGIAVYFDMVAGHMGDLIRSNDPGYPRYLPPPGEYNLRWFRGYTYPPPFNSLTHFHGHGQIENWDGVEQEIGTLSELDDLKTETQYVRDHMLDIWTYWMTETKVSGFRIDTVKHVELGFWEYFLPRLSDVAQELGRTNYFTFGEIYGGDDNFMARYIGELGGGPYKLDSAVDFQFYYTSNGVFARANQPPSNMAGRLNARAQRLGRHNLLMPNFIDNHDVPRFLHEARNNPGTGLAEQHRRLELALAFLFTAPGPPIVYYGTEQAFDGGHDPYNRENMWAGQFVQGPSVGDSFNEARPFFRLTKRLAELRTSLRPLRRGNFQALAARNNAPGEFAFLRRDETDTVLVTMNTATINRTLGALTVGAFAGQEIVNALAPSEAITVASNGVLPSRTLAPQSVQIWVLADQLPPQTPEVISFVPADSEAGVPVTTERLAIRFLLPMDEEATLAAIEVQPSVVYTPEWSEDSTELVLLIDGDLAPLTSYTVRLGTGARTPEGTSLPFPLTASWTTGRAPLELPEAPPLLGVVAPLDSPITVDGLTDEWPAFEIAERNVAIFPEAGGFVWVDALGDDRGPGTYTYPSDSSFSGQDCDIDLFRFGHTEHDLFFSVSLRSINTQASFFTPYIGLAIHTGPGGRTGALGIDLGTGSRGIAEVLVREDFAPNFELIYTGPAGGVLIRPDNSTEAITAAHNAGAATIEWHVSREALGLAEPLENREIAIVVYTGLETFGSMREVVATLSQWNPGGGTNALSDPDVFDLVGGSLLQQQADLSDFDAQEFTTILHSILRFELAAIEAEGGSKWSLY